MTLLTWNHSCGVGVRAMDDQHGILMDTMNELRLAVVSGRGREQMSELLDRLIEFTRMHFWSEEQLLEQSGFPGLAAHRAAHHSLLAQMLEAAHRVQYGKGVEMNSLLCWLQDTYAEHTEGLDRRAIAFGFLLTAEVRKNSGSVGFRLHLVLICPHTAPEMAVFGITKLDYVSQISFATRDLSVRNPNAIALDWTGSMGRGSTSGEYHRACSRGQDFHSTALDSDRCVS